MAFIRAIKKKYGTYYALVENKRINGKVVQKVLKYLGTSPFLKEYEIDPEIGGQLAQALFAGRPTEDMVKERLSSLGFTLPEGKLNKVSLVYNPPLGKLVIRIG